MRLAGIAGAVLLSAVALLSISCATPTYHLSTSVNGQGSVMPVSGDYLEGKSCILLAKPASGWEFDHWGGAASGNNSLVTITMSSDKAVTAYFVETGAVAPSEFETYTDEEYGFSISVPDSWLTMSMEELGLEESGIAFVSSGTCSGFPIIGSVLETEASGLSLQAYYDIVKSDTGAYEDFALLSEEEITVSGVPAMKVVFTGITEGYQVKVMACILVEGKTGWEIDLGCAPECWGIYEDTFNTMMNSFELLD